jgi:hypothetical protein
LLKEQSPVKITSLQAVGETALQRAAEINAALATNDRIEYMLSLLQMESARVAHPKLPPVSLARERIAGGIDDAGSAW